MNNADISMFFALLRSTLNESKLLSDAEKEAFSEDMLQNICNVSKKYDIAHMIGYALEKNNFSFSSNPYYNEIQKSVFIAVVRHERLEYERKKVCNLLETNKIPFIPLKGAVINKYYPHAWLRTSCDIDILIHESDLDKAVSLLTATGEYTCGTKDTHEVSIYSKQNVHIELHYNLIESEKANAADKILENIWDFAFNKDGFEYWKLLPNEWVYFYHIAHMVKHFLGGGCGVRSIADVYILNCRLNLNHQKTLKLLRKSRLDVFEKNIKKLSDFWFTGDPVYLDNTISKVEKFILDGEMYRGLQNYIKISQQRKGGKFAYAFSRIFLPYSIISEFYPILKKHKYLVPFMQVYRWFNIVFGGGIHKALKELEMNQNVSNQDAEEMLTILKDLDLH